MKTISCIILLLSCSLHVVAQLNIIPQNGGLKEYTIDNALPYDSLSNVDKRSFSSLPGQTLYMHGMKNVNQGYYEVFWTGNFLDGGKYPVYKVNGVSVTPTKEVVGKYYDVLKVWIKSDSRCCLLLREKESGDEIYYNPYRYPLCMTCLGFYEKLKRYIGQTFLSLAKRVETEDGQVITPAEGAEYHYIDIGLKMDSDGAFLIMKGADGIKVEAFPIGDEIYEFVSTKRVTMLKERYGNKYGEQIAFRKVDTGMTKEMVIAAWGKPYRKSEIKRKDKIFETWSFSGNRYVEIQEGKVVNVRIYN